MHKEVNKKDKLAKKREKLIGKSFDQFLIFFSLL